MIGKFKVWDKDKKEFEDETLFAIDSTGQLIWNTAIDEHDMFGGDDHGPAPSYLIPVHSTEKTNKNGVELFDGDICRDKYEGVGEIKHDVDLGWIFKYGSETDEFEELWRMLIGSAAPYFEKSGNKFENPELMETK